MTSRFALKAATIGALFLIASAAQAQRWQGGGGFDPAYAVHFGFAPGASSGPYASDGSDRYESNSGHVRADASSCVQHGRSHNPTTQTYFGYDGRRHSCP
jgi:BA14K-like protein